MGHSHCSESCGRWTSCHKPPAETRRYSSEQSRWRSRGRAPSWSRLPAHRPSTHCVPCGSCPPSSCRRPAYCGLAPRGAAAGRRWGGADVSWKHCAGLDRMSDSCGRTDGGCSGAWRSGSSLQSCGAARDPLREGGSRSQQRAACWRGNVVFGVPWRTGPCSGQARDKVPRVREDSGTS